jgi:peptide/nickel transport system permease protein
LLAYVVRRLLHVVPVLLGVSVVVFLTMKLVPGDQAEALLGPQATPEGIEQIRHALGLDQPIYVQYARWLWLVLHGDFGFSWNLGRPALDVLVPKITNTLILGVASFLIAAVLGVAGGVTAAVRSYSWLDRLNVGLGVIVGNAPPFWLGLVFIFVFAVAWGVFPSEGMHDLRGAGGPADLLRHLTLPALTTAAAPGAIILRQVRSSIIDTRQQDFVKVAYAKGLLRRVVLWRHIFRAALPPIITISGLQLGYLVGGAIFSEVVFAWPGLGLQLYLAVTARDLAVLQGAVLFIATAFVSINLAVDLLVIAVNPRLRSG